ncbi:biotin--[acetyl-CoA-carboxylase] ligase [Chakrabartyella piscis]|uniref:biotin--[acetyl-CoA-carboxylase] ligase n=1 Tax=Chakrabartyella piscis TaxID=2918914 RepID=UPI0029583B2A|nr:biotin--[acetyl-CoA-carboxylase] ligase [Chakrabartyella piscis]
MYRILELLRKKNDFLSGEEIGQNLSISRAAVWKGIQKLREEGYEIEAITNKGYRLVVFETMYNKREILEGLQTKTMGRNLYFYEKTDTTNACIRTLALEGAEEGTLAVAEYMTAGRGRMGRQWVAKGGTGIWMSLLLRPNIHPTKASTLTLLAGLAVCEALEAEGIAGVEIKWPNDILLNGKKLVGILTEMDCEMEAVHYVVLGIGINVNTVEFPEELQHIATSIYQETGKTHSRKRLLQRVLLSWEGIYEAFLEVNCDFSLFQKRYENKCYTLGKEVSVLGKERFVATAMGITPEGELVVIRRDTGKEEVVFSGEVSIRKEQTNE